MKKYIKPIVECYEFEVTTLVCTSSSSIDFGEKPFDPDKNEILGREDKDNSESGSNLWDSGW